MSENGLSPARSSIGALRVSSKMELASIFSVSEELRAATIPTIIRMERKEMMTEASTKPSADPKTTRKNFRDFDSPFTYLNFLVLPSSWVTVCSMS